MFIYQYNFLVDGHIKKLDPVNPEVKVGTNVYGSLVEVLGTPSRFDQLQDVPHGEHPEAAQLLRSVEDHRWETGRHFGIQSKLDASLNLVLTLHKQVKKSICVDDTLAMVAHQPD